MTLELRLRNDVWQVCGTVVKPDGVKVRVRKSTGYTKHQKQYASAALSRILLDTMNGVAAVENDAATLEDAINQYLSRPNPPGETDVSILHRLARLLGKTPLARLKTNDLYSYVTGRGNSAGTVAREMNTINAMMKHAREIGLDAPDITLKRPSVDDARSRWLTEDERDRLIAACSPEIKGLVTFLFYTGARIGEAFALTWPEVRGRQAFFTSYKGKMRKKRVRGVPLTHLALSAMGSPTGDYVFTAPNGAQWDRRKFYDYFTAACDRAGITDFTPHDCRHTFASHLVQKGASLRAVADLLGHTSLAMVMRYSHLAPNHLSDTVNLLGGGGTDGTHGSVSYLRAV